MFSPPSPVARLPIRSGLPRAILPLFLLPVLAAGLLGGATGAGALQIEREIVVRGLEISADVSGERFWTDVNLPDGSPEVAIGDPAIPSLRVTVPIEAEHWVAGVNLVVLADEVRELRHPVRPYGGEQSSRDAVRPSSEPNPLRYASAEPFPATDVALVREFELNDGRRFATFLIHPVRYTPSTGQLHLIRRARLVVDLQSQRPAPALLRERAALSPGVGPIDPRGRVLLSQSGFAPTAGPSVNGSLVEYIIVSPDDEDMVDEWQRLADWKTASGHPAVIRTVSWIRDAYPSGADLAESIRLFLRDAYTHWGLRWVLLGGDTSLVPTRYARSWFYNPSNSDQGTDVAGDFYYAALEGTWDFDADGIFGESYRASSQPGGPQVGDKVDFSPEIQVGRVSARNATEVSNYLDKYLFYVQTPASGYLDRMLMLGEVLFHSQWSRTGLSGGPDCDTGEDCTDPPCRVDDNGEKVCSWYDGATDCFELEQIIDGLGVGFDIDLVLERYDHWQVTQYEGALHPDAQRETLEGVVQAISEGYGIVQHVGHGDRDRWAVGEGRMMMGELSALSNGDDGKFFLCYGVNCSSAAIDYDCFGETMVLLPGHGSVAYVGCSNVDFPTSARGFTSDFYDLVFGEVGGTLGDGFFGSAAANGPAPNWETDYVARFLVFTMVLLGEPSMVVWRGTPGALDLAFNTSPAPGAQALEITVTSGGSGVAGATVCVQKEGEIYVVAQTGGDGTVDVPFWPQSGGEFQVTATSPTHRPVTETGTVGSSGSGGQIGVLEFEVFDDGSHGSSGNGNERIEVGETVRLAVPVRNNGSQTAQNVSLTLYLSSSAPGGLVTVTDGNASPGGGTIGAGQTATDDEGFLLTIADDPPEAAFDGADAVMVPFNLQVSGGSGSSTGKTYLTVTRPRLEVGINRMEDVEHPQDRRNLFVGLINAGKGTASGYHVKVAPAALNLFVNTMSGGMEVPSITLEMDDLDPGTSAQVGPFLLDVLHEGYARLELEVEDAGGRIVQERTLDLRAPAAPESVAAIGLPGSVTLTWGEATDPNLEEILGYKVQRAEEGSQQFEDTQAELLVDHRYMNDGSLSQLTEYSYKVAAIDSSGNLGTYSAPVTVYTSPGQADGWPSRIGTPTPSSPLICELDGWWGTGREIVFCGEDVYAYHGHGSEVTDGDNVGSTMGVFSTRGPLYWAKAAAGDINQDGKIELLAVSKTTTSSPAPTDGDSLYCWQGSEGKSPMWAIKLQNKISLATPVLANIDGSSDGRMEILLCAGKSPNGGLYVFQYNGARFSTTDQNGRLLDMRGDYLYQKPSIGDVDGDGDLEMIVSTRETNKDGALWIARPDGSTLRYYGGLKFSTLGLAAQQGTTGSPTVGNVDGGTDEEVFVVTPDYILAFKNNRDTPLWTQKLDARYDYELISEAPLGDIDGDGDLDLAVVDRSGRIWALDARTGNRLQNFTNLHAPPGNVVRYGSCILANVDDDSRPEIVFGDGDRYIYAYTYQGVPARGFPVFVGGKMHQQSLAAWDVDNDGYQNLVVQANNTQQLLVLDLEGVEFDPRHNPWPMRYRDDRNTGRYVEVALDAHWPVAIQMSVDAPIVSGEGSVRLEWSSPEPVLSFRIHRAPADGGVEELIGEVPGRSGAATQSYTFADTPPGPGVYQYRIAPVGPGGREEDGRTVLAEVGVARPLTLQLRGAFPNPLRPARDGGSRVVFALPGRSGQIDVRLRVIDLQGRTTRRLVEGSLPPGVHTVAWDGRDDAGLPLPAGLYLLRLDAGSAVDSQRVLLIR